MRSRNPLGPATLVSGVAGQTPVAYTPTITWVGSTVTTPAGFALKIPGALLIWATWTISVAGGSGVLTISVPTGYAAAFASPVGMYERSPGGSPAQLLVAAGALTGITGVSVAPGTTGYGGFATIPTTT